MRRGYLEGFFPLSLLLNYRSYFYFCLWSSFGHVSGGYYLERAQSRFKNTSIRDLQEKFVIAKQELKDNK